MRVRLFGLGLLLEACAAAQAPLAVLPLPPARSAGAAAEQPPSTSSSPSAFGDSPVAIGSAAPAEAVVSSPPQVLIEAPYSALGHPRLATEMMTLARDEELFQWALGGSADPEHVSNRPGYHPATRVVVDVQLLSRAPKGAARRLLTIARSTGYWPLRACFETAQRAAPKPERSARVRLTLGGTGKVLGSRSMGPRPERDYARCVLERVRKLDFTPGFSRKLDIDVSVKQWPGHAPVPPRAPDDSPALHVSPDTAASLEAVAPALTACYEQGLATDAKLWGRIALRLELASDGAVQAASPVETRFPRPDVVECARQALLGARLRSPGVSELTFAVRLGQGAPPAPPAALGAPPLSVEAPPEPPAPPAPPALAPH
jgi:hypothetical protein